MGNTVASLNMASIKMAAKLPDGDRRAMASQMQTTPEFIRERDIHSFALWTSGAQSAVAVNVPVGRLHDSPMMSDTEFVAVRDLMRRKYSWQVPSTASGPQPGAGAAAGSTFTSSSSTSAQGGSSPPPPPQGGPPRNDDINTDPSTGWRPPPPK